MSIFLPPHLSTMMPLRAIQSQIKTPVTQNKLSLPLKLCWSCISSQMQKVNQYHLPAMDILTVRYKIWWVTPSRGGTQWSAVLWLSEREYSRSSWYFSPHTAQPPYCQLPNPRKPRFCFLNKIPREYF